MELLVVGAGRVGLQLAHAAAGAGATVRAVLARPGAPPRPAGPAVPVVPWSPGDPLPPADTVVVAVPDRAIPAVGRDLAASGRLHSRTVLHTSGLLTADALAPCRDAGAAVGSWHPLAAIPPLALGPVRWEGVWTAIEGDPGAIAAARRLSRLLGCRAWEIDPSEKPRYHAAAAAAANLTHLLVAAAVREFEAAGHPDPAAALERLVRGAVAAALRHPDLSALTGPLARGDAETVRRHLEVLPAPLAAAYRALAALVPRAPR